MYYTNVGSYRVHEVDYVANETSFAIEQYLLNNNKEM